MDNKSLQNPMKNNQWLLDLLKTIVTPKKNAIKFKSSLKSDDDKKCEISASNNKDYKVLKSNSLTYQSDPVIWEIQIEKSPGAAENTSSVSESFDKEGDFTFKTTGKEDGTGDDEDEKSVDRADDKLKQLIKAIIIKIREFKMNHL